MRVLPLGQQLHQSVFAVAGVQAERQPHQCRGCRNAEADAHPLIDARHVEDDEQHEHGEQPSGEDEQVLRFQPLELDALTDSLVYSVFHNFSNRRITGRRSAESSPRR